ncbi:uncharacterized protein V1518DRAFT_423630 [Limtongia smithiae]|uniref:uncharacterized protein n=1 Tax=Limtongia smithiae TaxID=1125753 RepID=UPI0034CE4A09
MSAPVPNSFLDDDDDELSELDEDQFKDIDEAKIVPITEDVYKLQRHKRPASTPSTTTTTTTTTDASRPRTSASVSVPPKKRERTRTAKRGDTAAPREKKARRTPSTATPKEKAAAVLADLASLDPETRKIRELEQRMDAALKPTRRRKNVDEDDLEQMQDQKIAELGDRMRAAAMQDADAIKDGAPATHKLHMLKDVREVLQKHALYDSILDNNLLECCRLWLEPLPDASLPAYSIQRELFSALQELPIKTVHLRESGVGKVVLYYHKSRKPQPDIKRIADKLLGDWSRPIMSQTKPLRTA